MVALRGDCLTALEIGSALFEERRHTFGFVLDGFSEQRHVGAMDGAFAETVGPSRAVRKLGCQIADCLRQLVIRRDLTNHPPIQRLLRSHTSICEGHLYRARQADIF